MAGQIALIPTILRPISPLTPETSTPYSRNSTSPGIVLGASKAVSTTSYNLLPEPQDKMPAPTKEIHRILVGRIDK